MFVIDDIISALVSQSVSTVQGRFNRNEKVIKLLEKFNLKPDEPPEDFEGVYIYTLIEYGAGKPQTSLKLFRHNTIKAAFQTAFEQDNPNLLLETSAEFIEQSALGTEIEAQNLDYRRELAEFSALFLEIASRSRTPKEIIRDRALQSLQQTLSSLHSQIHHLNLPQLQGEIAQLAQNYQTLLPPAPARESELAQQMRGWFEALRYDFEAYETWGDNYFEWIINIPARRGFDRILIRGVEGEAGMGDFLALRQGVELQKTDEGWLVAQRRISRAVRDELEKRENRHLFGYTFDELLDEAADFSLYFTWLEAQVKNRAIDQMYVSLACTKEEIDPRTHQRLGVSRYDERDGWIDSYADLWLADPVKEHLSVLGEFGTGKTWFVLHYAWTALQRYLEAKQRGTERPRIPLVIPLRDYAKAVNVESLFSEFIFRKHEIPIPNYSAFVQLNRMGKLLLIFDGFDEMAARIDKQLTINNFWELARAIVPGAKAILTCRTEHFPEAKEGRRLLNAELQASTSNLTGEPPQFEVLELEKFDDAQIRQVLSFRAQPETVERVMGNPQLLDLARRPVMVDLILEALPEIEAGKPVDISRIYLYAVRRKMERDIKSERTFTSMADKLYFLCELSWEMLSSDRMNLNYREFPEHLRRLFGLEEQKDLDHWQYDMMGQTMLIRNAEGDYTPAHRSLLEFFVAYKFAAELGVLAEDFAEIVGISSPSSTPLSPTLSEGGWEDRSVGTLRETFGKMPLPKAVLDLLVPMLNPGEGTKERLLEVIRATREKTEEEVGYVGGNAATVLVKRDPAALEGCDLSGCVVLRGDFVNASLRDVNFTSSVISQSSFNKVLGFIWSVAFSPDGKRLATADSDGVLHLWDVDSGQELASYTGHTNRVYSVAFNCDGKILASGSADRTVKIWSINTGECLYTLEHTDLVRSVAFSPNGKWVASGSFDSIIRLWDVRTGQCLKNFQGHSQHIWSVAFSPTGETLASASSDRTIKLWNVATGECSKTFSEHTQAVHSIAFSPDGQNLASGSIDRTVKVWKVDTGECFHTFFSNVEWRNCALAFHPSGTILACGGKDGILQLWNIETGERYKTLHGHDDTITSLAFRLEGSILASGSADQTVRLWNIETDECFKVLRGISDWIRAVVFSPSNDTIVSGNDVGMVKSWNINTGKCSQLLQKHKTRVYSITFSPSGKLLAFGGGDRTVGILNTQTKLIKTFAGHTDWVNSIAFSPSGEMLASGSDDRTIKLWSTDREECLMTFEEQAEKVHSVAFSPLGELLASGSGSTVKLWHIPTGQCLRAFQEHRSIVWCVRFSPNGQVLASSSSFGGIRLWDIQRDECLMNLQEHNDWVHSVNFSPCGSFLVSCSGDHTVRLWNVQTGECVKTFYGHTNQVYSVGFSPDGKTIVSGGGDRTIKIWDVETGECLKTERSTLRKYEYYRYSRLDKC